jgi:hypothetical protein
MFSYSSSDEVGSNYKKKKEEKDEEKVTEFVSSPECKNVKTYIRTKLHAHYGYL